MATTQIQEDHYMISEGNANVLVSLVDSNINMYCDCRDDCKSQKITTHGGDKEVISWGKSNNTPYERECLIMDNNIVGTIIQRRRDYLVGTGLIGYREEFVDGECKIKYVDLHQDIKDWIKSSRYPDYVKDAAGELCMHAQIFTEYNFQRDGKVKNLRVLPSRYMRAEKKEFGKDVQHYQYADFTAKNGTKLKTTKLNTEHNKKTGRKFVSHAGDSIFYNGYYYTPVWWGSKKWISLANVIPEFHLYNLKHGYTIRFHIEVPKDYFLQSTNLGSSPTQAQLQKMQSDAKSREQDFMDQVNDFLCGIENTGRAVFTKYDFEKSIGKEIPGIKISPITADLKDEALLKLFEKTNQANISAQGIHPTLANIETQGKLSSGSEIRNALLAYLTTQYISRQTLLKSLDTVANLNKWYDLEGMSDIKFAFKDAHITKLDENKSGVKTVTNE